MRDVWQAAPEPKRLPYGLFVLPDEIQSPEPLLWQGTLDAAGIAQLRQLIYTPLAREISQALAAGDAVVWVLLNGDDAEENRRVRKLLDDSLAGMQAELKLPHELDPNDTVYTQTPAIGVPLRLSFSVIEADLQDPANQMMKALCRALGTEPAEFAAPMILPVFGRARAIALLAGEDIDEFVFKEIGAFLTGACSCRVKTLNPGFDLLLPFPWDEVLYDKDALARVLQRPPWAVANQGTASPAADTPTVGAAKPGIALVGGLIGLILLIMFALVAVHWIRTRR
jgi:hypothetical protein